MRIIFTKAAARDLVELRAYLEPISPDGLRSVVLRLEKLIGTIPANPRIGRPTTRQDVRELVEPRYGFLIPYAFIKGIVFVLRIYRSKREPLEYRTLKVPRDNQARSKTRRSSRQPPVQRS